MVITVPPQPGLPVVFSTRYCISTAAAENVLLLDADCFLPRGLRLLVVLIPVRPTLGAVGMLETKGFSLITWNILAPSYAPASKYPWASEENLAWRTRRGRIVDRLESLDADAVCLQEVECAHWDDLEQRFAALGYDSVLQQVQCNHPIANAVLLKKGRLRSAVTSRMPASEPSSAQHPPTGYSTPVLAAALALELALVAAAAVAAIAAAAVAVAAFSTAAAAALLPLL